MLLLGVIPLLSIAAQLDLALSYERSEMMANRPKIGSELRAKRLKTVSACLKAKLALVFYPFKDSTAKRRQRHMEPPYKRNEYSRINTIISFV